MLHTCWCKDAFGGEWGGRCDENAYWKAIDGVEWGGGGVRGWGGRGAGVRGMPTEELQRRRDGARRRGMFTKERSNILRHHQAKEHLHINMEIRCRSFQLHPPLWKSCVAALKCWSSAHNCWWHSSERRMKPWLRKPCKKKDNRWRFLADTIEIYEYKNFLIIIHHSCLLIYKACSKTNLLDWYDWLIWPKLCCKHQSLQSNGQELEKCDSVHSTWHLPRNHVIIMRIIYYSNAPGGTPIYKLYGYVLHFRVWFSSCFSLK